MPLPLEFEQRNHALEGRLCIQCLSHRKKAFWRFFGPVDPLSELLTCVELPALGRDLGGHNSDGQDFLLCDYTVSSCI